MIKSLIGILTTGQVSDQYQRFYLFTVTVQSYLHFPDILDIFQSALKAFCSTELALLRICNHILLTSNYSGSALLMLLNVRAAFHAVDPTTLVARLQVGVNAIDSGPCQF